MSKQRLAPYGTAPNTRASDGTRTVKIKAASPRCRLEPFGQNLSSKARGIEHVVAELRLIDRVEEISIVTGTTDLLVRARVADLADLRQLLVQGIWAIQGVERVETTVAVETEAVPTFTENLIGLFSTGPQPPHEVGGR